MADSPIVTNSTKTDIDKFSMLVDSEATAQYLDIELLLELNHLMYDHTFLDKSHITTTASIH